MVGTLADILELLSPTIPGELIDESHWQELMAIARWLPAPFSSLFGFECRLADPAPQADFAVCVKAQEGQRDLLAGTDVIAQLAPFLQHLTRGTLQQPLPPELFAHPIWQQLQQFGVAWANPSSTLFAGVEDLWLEFDVAGRLESVPLPSVFFGAEQLNQPGATRDLLQPAIALLTAQAVPQPTLNQLEWCLQALPAHARAFQVGVLLARRSEGVRLCIADLALGEIEDYLHQIGWPGDRGLLQSLLQQFAPALSKTFLNLQVTDQIEPSIGIECYLASQTAWQSFLHDLTQAGFCHPAKRDALLEYPGYVRRRDRQVPWPDHLRQLETWLAPNYESTWLKRLNHLKFTYHPGQPLTFKAYLAVAHCWVETSAFPYLSPTPTPALPYLQQIQDYYDRTNPLYLRYVGKTYQAGLLKSEAGGDSDTASNLFLAERAGIRAHQSWLDAGCGVCGPSIDLVNAIAGLQIAALTLSPAQAETAQELIATAGLTERIRVQVGDFHHLPFRDRQFDGVFFFESALYAYDFVQLFREVLRVLQPGGRLYLKDVFAKEPPLTESEQQELTVFDQIYAIDHTPPMSEVLAAIAQVGFEQIYSASLDDLFSTEKFIVSMLETHQGTVTLSEFGQTHFQSFDCLPVFFGEIQACKPGV